LTAAPDRKRSKRKSTRFTTYYRLIDEFGKRTGVPVVMNTSFNLRGEATVHTPTDAIRTFFSSGMDALVLGSFLVEK
jgi:carbamoyltransferase